MCEYPSPWPLSANSLRSMSTLPVPSVVGEPRMPFSLSRKTQSRTTRSVPWWRMPAPLASATAAPTNSRFSIVAVGACTTKMPFCCASDAPVPSSSGRPLTPRIVSASVLHAHVSPA